MLSVVWINGFGKVVTTNFAEIDHRMNKFVVEQERSNSFKEQILKAEDEKKFWLEKFEFMLRQEEVKDKSKDFDKCVSWCEMLKAAANFVMSYGVTGRLPFLANETGTD